MRYLEESWPQAICPTGGDQLYALCDTGIAYRIVGFCYPSNIARSPDDRLHAQAIRTDSSDLYSRIEK